MSPDGLVMIIPVLLFLGFIFLLVYYLPSFAVKLRASNIGLSLTYKQARTIAKDFCNTRDFLVDAKEIWFWADIPVEHLTFHYSAKGDLTNLKEGIILMKQKKREIDFKFLSTLDLAGKDLKKLIAKAEANNWKLDIKDHLVDPEI